MFIDLLKQKQITMKKFLTSRGYKVSFEKQRSGRFLVVIASDKKVLMSHAYGNSKLTALLKCVRIFNNRLLPEFRPI